jgi:hypothetical protein
VATVSVSTTTIQQQTHHSWARDDIVPKIAIVNLFTPVSKLNTLYTLVWGTDINGISGIVALDCSRDQGSRRWCSVAAAGDLDLGTAYVELSSVFPVRMANNTYQVKHRNGVSTCGGAPGLWSPSCWIRRRYSPSGIHFGIVCV